MDPIVVFAGATILYLVFRGKKAPDPLEPPVDTTPPVTKPADPPNGVYPDAGMTLAQAQKILIALGYDLGASGADGKYGPKTRAALIAYQTLKAFQGLSAHGFLDKPTATSLGGEALPVTEEGYADVGYEQGYRRGFTSRGNGYDYLGACGEVGAVLSNGGTCPPEFKTAYDKGFSRGSYDIGYLVGKEGALSGAPSSAIDSQSSSPSFKSGVLAAYVEIQKGGFGDAIVSGSARTARVAGVDIMMVSRERPERMRVDRAERMR